MLTRSSGAPCAAWLLARCSRSRSLAVLLNGWRCWFPRTSELAFMLEWVALWMSGRPSIRSTYDTDREDGRDTQNGDFGEHPIPSDCDRRP